MDAVELLLKGIDDAWAHPWESLTGALKGLARAEARWQPPAYRREKRKKGWPPPGSIHWHLTHLAACTREYTERLRERPRDVPWKPLKDPLAEIPRLRRIHAAYRREVAQLGPQGLDAARLHADLRHDVWHAAQIRLVRRLWRARRR